MAKRKQAEATAGTRALKMSSVAEDPSCPRTSLATHHHPFIIATHGTNFEGPITLLGIIATISGLWIRPCANSFLPIVSAATYSKKNRGCRPNSVIDPTVTALRISSSVEREGERFVEVSVAQFFSNGCHHLHLDVWGGSSRFPGGSEAS